MEYVASRFLVDAPFVGPDKVARRLLFQTRAGKYVLLSELDWQKLTRGHHSLLEASLLENLKAYQFVVEASRDELKEVLLENEKENQETKSLFQVIMPTASCQLACNDLACGSYCGQTHRKVKLAREYHESVCARITEKLQVGKFSNLHIGWFGGEPLLGIDVIRSLSPKLMSLATSHGASYSSKIVTNGLALTSERSRELYHSLGISSFEITLDGVAEAHDRRRPTKVGHKATFQKIFQHVCLLGHDSSLSDANITVRCNVDSRNRDSVYPLLELLCEHELQRRVSFYIAPVHPWGNEVEKLTIPREEFARFELDVLCKMLNLGFNVHLIPVRKKITCLSTQKFADVVDPYGMIHKCTETPLVESYQVTAKSPALRILNEVAPSQPSSQGQYSNRYGIDSLDPTHLYAGEGNSLHTFNSAVAQSQYPCTSCKMLPVCGGGCPLSWEQGHIPCPSAKLNIEGRLLLAYVHGALKSKETLPVSAAA